MQMNVQMNQVMETHAPDGGPEFSMRPLLSLVEDILKNATLTRESIIAPSEPQSFDLDEMLSNLFPTIDWISVELSATAPTGGKAHGTTLAILNMLAPYSWETKLVLTLAAFAFNYGKFCLLAQSRSSNRLAKPIAILKQLPTIEEHLKELKPPLQAPNGLNQYMLNVTKAVVEITELPSAYLSHKDPAISAAMGHVPIAVYWTIKTAVACASQITNLTCFGHKIKISQTDPWELSALADKLKKTDEQLQNQINICIQQGEDKLYQILQNLFQTNHSDNMKRLTALICPSEDIQELVVGTTKKTVDIESLWMKNVWLLISGLDISKDELFILEQIHSECKGHETQHGIRKHELVWIPVVVVDDKWTDEMERQFKDLQLQMPWYTVLDPRLVVKGVIRFVKEKWHFRNKPILVVLDKQGEVVCPNAIHMMWIWGSNAYPFTTKTEEALWKEETWSLELLVKGIDQTIQNWNREGKYVFLYGSDNIEWIRTFTKLAHQVAQAARIPLEMVYVGKSSKCAAIIKYEKLSCTWQDKMVRLFWTRIESMLVSKIQVGKVDEHDPVMKQIMRLLSFDKAGGWAALSKGSTITVNGHGTTVLTALLEYDLWKEHVPTKGYELAFKEHHDKIHDMTRPCCRFEFQSTMGRIPERMRCPECQSLMEELFTFVCCHGKVVPSIYE